jgi:hypothetical protein
LLPRYERPDEKQGKAGDADQNNSEDRGGQKSEDSLESNRSTLNR